MSSSLAARRRQAAKSKLDSCDPDTLARVHTILEAESKHRKASPGSGSPTHVASAYHPVQYANSGGKNRTPRGGNATPRGEH